MKPLYGDANDIRERAQRGEELARYAAQHAESTTKPIAESGWSKGLPDVEGDYFSRVDEYDKHPTLIRIENCVLYEIGQGGDLRREYAAEEDYEYLGPFTASDFEQLIRLRQVQLTKAELTLLIDHHSQQETMADAMDMPESAEYHKKRREILAALREALTPKGEQS